MKYRICIYLEINLHLRKIPEHSRESKAELLEKMATTLPLSQAAGLTGITCDEIEVNKEIPR